MYLFEAHFTNMITCADRKAPIYIETQEVESEKDCYIYAMGLAYDMKHENESLSSVEFIAC